MYILVIFVIFVLFICIYQTFYSQIAIFEMFECPEKCQSQGKGYFDNSLPMKIIETIFIKPIDMASDLALNKSKTIRTIVKDQMAAADEVTSQLNKTVQYANTLVKDWVPNVSWIYKYRDKSIEMERARQGLPPMIPSKSNVNFHMKINNKKYLAGLA